ncbi:MAG TPA: phage tail tip lysozyme [Stellaceae bacterium]|nr:phage tail tip lysozyme [Stellaceae bacterium]
MLSMSACSVFEGLKLPVPGSAVPGPMPPQPAPFLSVFSTQPAPQPTSAPTPEAAHAEIVDWLHKHGYQDFQIQAMVEHARTESGFRACAAGPGGYHYLFQWSSARLEQLQKFAGYPGCPQLDTQLAFADHELRGDPKFSCFWSATTEPAAYTALRRGFGGGSC